MRKSQSRIAADRLNCDRVNEAETRAEHIDPALKAAGWGVVEGSRIRREYLKLATGVDARNIRNIVLMRPINSIIEFKQIIGRGTRLYDGKDYFTIYDFVKAHQHFSDKEWDGEPEAPEPPTPPVYERVPPPDIEPRDPRPQSPQP